MATFSHSKIQTFSQCRYKYKLQYIDKIKVSVPNTIEAHLGSCVHSALEKLYLDLKHGHLDTSDDIIKHFSITWEKTYTEDILINDGRYSKEDYFNLGLRFILDYYKHYHPFDNLRTIDLETQDFLDLTDGDKYHVRIDRLSTDSDGNYYVCDYKTNNSLKTRDDLDKDTQLAMYSIWVRDRYPDAKKVFLVWHFLAFDKEIVIEKIGPELESIRKDIERKIVLIKDCKEFPTSRSSLCNWCLYKDICPEFADITREKKDVSFDSLEKSQKNLLDFMKTAKKKDINLNDESIMNIIDSYSNMVLQKRILEDDIEHLRERIISYHVESGETAINGSKNSVSVSETETIQIPSKHSKDLEEIRERLEIESILKENGIYEEFICLDDSRLKNALQERSIPDSIIENIMKLVKKSTTYRVNVKENK